MASGGKTVITDSQALRCPICLDVYTAPKNLPCLHTYCQHCLHNYIMKNVQTGEKGATFNCPECRKETYQPLPDIHVDKWAEHYPYNTLLLSVLPPEKRKVEKSCDSCLYDGTSVIATSYCIVCNEALCATCDKVHKKNKALRAHTVVNIQDLFTNPELAVNLSVKVTCPEHVDKELEFYCKSHISMCCSECFYKGHRGCTEVVQLKDHSEKLLKEREANRVVDRLKQLRSHLDQFKKENEGTFKKIEAKVKHMSYEINVLMKKINTLLENVKAKVTMESNALLKEESMIRHEENQQCESISSAITNSLYLLETVLAHGNTIHVLTTLHKIEEQLVHYESAVKEKYCEVRHVDTKLCLDDRLLSLVKCSETTIANIDIVEQKHRLTPSLLPPSIETTVKATTMRHDTCQGKKKTVEGYKPPEKYRSSKPLRDCKLDRTGEFNTDTLDGKPPRYTGITCLPDDKIMLVDSENSTCTLYDSSSQQCDVHKLISRPRGVCIVDRSQVAVTLPLQKEIQLLTVNSSIQAGRRINTSLSCSGIAALSKDHLVVSGRRNDILYWCVVSMDGYEKSPVQVCPSTYYSHLVVNNERTCVYVSCYRFSAAVYAYSVDGTLIFKYEHQDLDGAAGVAVDKEDNLYVVGEHSDNIHQVSADGTTLQVFPIKCRRPVIAVSFTPSGDKFLLAGSSSLVEIFKLK